MQQQFNLKVRMAIAKHVATSVWGSAPSTQRIGIARKCIQSLLEDGFTDRQTIWRKATDLLNGGWQPVQ